MPGSGKTTVSKCLGKLYNLMVVDTDEEIVKKHGRIADIFEKYGESVFRDFETQAVEEVCSLKNAVISTGGGCLIREKNRELFKSTGKIVYLKATIQTLLSRVAGDTERPLLYGNAEEKLKKLMGERAHIYEACADIVVDTDGLSPEQISKIIVDSVK